MSGDEAQVVTVQLAGAWTLTTDPAGPTIGEPVLIEPPEDGDAA
jgi:hypothetical protein